MSGIRRSRLLRIAVLFVAVAGYVAFATNHEERRMATPLPSAAATSADAPAVDGARLLADVRTLSSIPFEGRRTGTQGSRQAQAFLQARFESLGLKPFGVSYAQPFAFTRTSIKALVTPGRPYRTSYPSAVNYIGMIPGSARPERYLVVSAHYDHLGIKGGKLYPGADDNASGVAAMLEIAAWFKAHPPRHTVVIAAFDAEELGLRGARAFVDALPFPKRQLALDLNLDMVSHNDRNEIFAAGAGTAPALRALLEQAAGRSTVHVKLGHDRPPYLAGMVEDWSESSDHGPFHEAGVPYLYFGVEDHADYHAPGDTFEHINPAFFTKVASLLVDVAAAADKNL